MRVIPLFGITLFLRALIQKGSIRAFIIITNGILFHGLTTKKNFYERIPTFLRYNDIVANTLLIAYSLANDIVLYPYVVVGMANFIFNIFILRRYFSHIVNMEQRELFHVLGVQLPFAIGLEKTLKLL